MKHLLLPALLALSTAACASTSKELVCTQQGKVTVHYKNALDVYYNAEQESYYIMYDEGVVFYKAENNESCTIKRR